MGKQVVDRDFGFPAILQARRKPGNMPAHPVVHADHCLVHHGQGRRGNNGLGERGQPIDRIVHHREFRLTIEPTSAPLIGDIPMTGNNQLRADDFLIGDGGIHHVVNAAGHGLDSSYCGRTLAPGAQEVKLRRRNWFRNHRRRPRWDS